MNCPVTSAADCAAFVTGQFMTVSVYVYCGRWFLVLVAVVAAVA